MLLKMAWRNIIRSKGYFISFIMTLSMFIVLVYGMAVVESSLGALILDTNMELGNLNMKQVFEFLKYFTYIIVVLFSIYVSRFFIKRRSSEVALLKSLGLSRTSIMGQFVIENTIVVFSALIIGSLAGVLFSRFIVILAFSLLGIQLENVGFAISLKGFMDVGIITVAIWLVLNLLPTRSIIKVSISKLFETQHVNDKPLKGRWISAIIFVVSFTYLVLKLNDASEILKMIDLQQILELFVVAVIVIISFFHGFIFTLFGVFKKQEKSLTSPVMMLGGNHLSSNLKSIYGMLTFITIFSAIITVLIVNVFGTLSIADTAARDQLKTLGDNYLKGISLNESHHEEIVRVLNEAGDYEVFSMPIYLQDNDTYAIKQSDFINLLEKFEFKNINAFKKIQLPVAYYDPCQLYGMEVVACQDFGIHQSPYLTDDDIKQLQSIIDVRDISTHIIIHDNERISKMLMTPFYIVDDAQVKTNNAIYFYTMFETPTKANAIAMMKLLNEKAMIAPDNIIIAQEFVFQILIPISFGLMQIILFTFMISMIIALIMALFFRSLENIEKGEEEYIVAKRLGFSFKSLYSSIILETFVTQLLPFYIGVIGSLWMFYMMIGKGFDFGEGNKFTFMNVMLQPSVVIILGLIIFMIHFLAIIIIMSMTKKINQSQLVKDL